jgi:hypothetical protein
VDKILLKRGSLEFSGRYKALPFDFVLFDEACEASFDNETSRFHIRVPCLHEKELFFADLEALEIGDPALLASPACQSAYLILRQNGTIHYGPVNHLVKLVLQKTLARFTA